MSNYILDPTPPTFSNNFRYILDATPLRYLLAQTTLKYTLNGPMQQLRTTFLVLRFSLVRSTSNVALNATRLLVCNFPIAMEICHPPCQLEKTIETLKRILVAQEADEKRLALWHNSNSTKLIQVGDSIFLPFSKYGIRVLPQCQRHLKKTHVFLSTVSCPAVCLCICSICICICERYCVVCDLFSFVSNYAQCLPFPNMVTTALVRLAGLN